MARPSTLPAPAEDLVLTTLRKARAPLTAYVLLEKLNKKGIKSPPIIYRALDTLMRKGVVHRIKALGAFVACDCAKSHTHTLSVITVCSACSEVKELHDHAVIHQLEALRDRGIRLHDHAVIELPVTCVTCTA